MVGFNVMKWTDPLVSVDIHNAIIPPSPAPVPLPYMHCSFLGHGVIASKSKFSGSPETLAKHPILTLSIQPMLQGTDTGYFDVHLGNLANVLYPLILAFSSSKSLFAASTVQMNGSPTSAAILVMVNMNLNCNWPVSYPNGCIFSFSTVQAGMSMGDILAGVWAGIAQLIVEFALLKFIPFASGLPISRSFNQSISQLSSRLFMRSVTSNIHVATPLTNALGRYFGTSSSPTVTSIIGSEVGSDLVSGLTGIAMGETPVEDWAAAAPRVVSDVPEAVSFYFSEPAENSL